MFAHPAFGLFLRPRSRRSLVQCSVCSSAPACRSAHPFLILSLVVHLPRCYLVFRPPLQPLTQCFRCLLFSLCSMFGGCSPCSVDTDYVLWVPSSFGGCSDVRWLPFSFGGVVCVCGGRGSLTTRKRGGTRSEDQSIFTWRGWWWL